MDISNIEMSFELGASIVVTISLAGLLAYFNREKLAKLFEGAALRIRIPFFGIEVEVEKLLELQGKLEKAGVSEANVDDAAASVQQPQLEYADLTARDIVLESWGSLKQIVYDASAHRNIHLTPVTKTPEAVDRLVHKELIPKEIAESLISLYDEGKKVADSPGKLNKSYASLYKELAERLVDWIMVNVIITKKPEKEEGLRPTRISKDYSSFPPPRSGHAAATLVGLKGPMRGQHFPIDKEIYRIGADLANNLPIKHDKFVSGKHAYLVYKTGSLFLYDEHSRNGTFLNNNRVKDTALKVRQGDLIRIGDSTFEVSQALGR